MLAKQRDFSTSVHFKDFMMAYDAEDDDFDVVHVCEDSGSEDSDDLPSTSDVLLPVNDKPGRVFIVSTARTTGGHRPSCTFEGDLHEVCISPDGGAYLQRVLQSDDLTPLSLSLRYEPPSPKFSRNHPALTSYRVKLLQGSQFIYLHRGLPKVCLVDRQARSLSWGQVQLVLRDTQQLNSVLAVLRHADVQHAAVWPPHVSMLWLGGSGEEQRQQQQQGIQQAEQLQGGQQGMAEAAPSPEDAHTASNVSRHPPQQWSWWSSMAQQLPSTFLPKGPHWHDLADSVSGLLLLLGATAAAAGVMWRSYTRNRKQ